MALNVMLLLEKALQMEEVVAVTFREQTLVELNPISKDGIALL